MKHRPSITEIEWSRESLVHNVFRVLESVFGYEVNPGGTRKIKADARTAFYRDERGRKVVLREFYTLEAAITHFEQEIFKAAREWRRSWKKILTLEWVPIRVYVPAFSGAGPIPGAGPYLFAIAYDTASNSSANQSTGVSVAHTATGSDRLAVAMMFFGGATPSTAFTSRAATYGGASMTAEALPTKVATNRGMEIFTKVAPSTGSQNVVFSWGGGGTEDIFVIQSYTGVSQDAPVNAMNSGGVSGGTAISISVSVAMPNSVLVGGYFLREGGSAGTPDANVNERFDNTLQATGDKAVANTGASTLGWTVGSGAIGTDSIIGAVALTPQPTGSDRSLDLESGSSQYASVADASALRLSGDFTIEAWIRLETLSSGLGYSQTIISKDNTSVGWTFRIESGANKLDFVRNDATQYTGATALQTGVWYHVAVSLSGSTLKIYLNGKEDFSGAYTDHTDATQSLRVGNSTTNGTRYFDGLIKDVRLFSDARTQAEIVADARTRQVSDANLIAEWSFNGDYLDNTSNNYDLTASGSPTFSPNVPWIAPNGAADSDFLLDNLVSWWSMDETSGTRADAHASNDLTDNNTVGSAVGKKSNAADFEAGNSESLSIVDGSQSGLDITGDMAFSLWLNMESAPGSGSLMGILGKWRDTSNQHSWLLAYYNNGGTLGIRLYNSNDGSTVGSATVNYTLTTATWFHVAAVYRASAGALDIYVNGIYIGTATGLQTSTFNSTAPFFIGGDTDVAYLDGLVDEVAVYTRKLHYGDVLDLFNASAAIAYIGTTQYDQAVNASVAVSASMLTPKTIVRTLDATATGSASVAMIKDFVRTLEATASITAQALKGLAMELSASTSITASILAQRAYLVAMNAAVAVSASTQTAIGKLLEATASVSATLTKTFSVAQLLSATASITATLEAGREKVLEAAVAVSSTIQTAIGKTLTANVSIIAKVFAPFWRTKYPAHGDGDDYDVKYPHD